MERIRPSLVIRGHIPHPFERDGIAYTLIDTAGVRRRARISERIEKFSVIKTLQALDNAHVVILVMDAREPVTDQDTGLIGMVIESVAPGRATLTMTVREDMSNGHGICHGGFIFTLADSAFAFACNSHNRATVAQAAKIDFLRPARRGDPCGTRHGACG